MKKKGAYFFIFLQNLISFIKNTTFKTNISKSNLPWNELPGYDILVGAFIQQMNKRDILKYPNALVSASVSLLNNE